MMNRAERLLDAAPGSSYMILDSLASSIKSLPKSQRMRHALLMTDAKNKMYKDISQDTIMQEVTEYYSTHGTARERMKSRYCLCCVLRDRGDAPGAIRNFYEALADTADSECDYNLVAAIYGQIAER